MAASILESKGVAWHHVADIAEADLEQLQENFKFHHLDYEDIRVETPISKMDPYKHYIFFVFHVPIIEEKTGYLYGEEIYVFLSKDSLVTLTHVPIPALEAFVKRMERSTKFRASVLGKGSAFALHKILAEVFKDGLTRVGELTLEVRRLEKAIEERHEKQITVDLGHTRRNILFLRHIIDPQRALLSSLTTLKRSFISDDMALYFDDVRDVLDTIWLATDNLKLIIDGLFDVNEALLSHRTNEIVTVLTFLSAVLMVPTLIAGFYGMNVPWLPYAGSPGVIGAFYVLGFCVVLMVLLVMRSRR